MGDRLGGGQARGWQENVLPGVMAFFQQQAEGVEAREEERVGLGKMGMLHHKLSCGCG